MKIIAKIKNSKVEDLIIEVEKNLHKRGHVNANYGKNGTTCPPSTYKSENYGVLGRPGTCFILFHSHALFNGEFHAEQESEIRFSLAQLLALHFLSF